MKRKIRRRNLRLLWAIAFMLNVSFIAPVNTIYRLERGLSLLDVTTLSSLYTALLLVLTVPFGLLADRMGYRRTMQLSCCMRVLGQTVFYFGEGMMAFALERILESFSIAAGISCMSAYLFVSAEPEEKPRAFGGYTACTGAGMMLSAICFSTWLGGNMERSAFLTVIAQVIAFGLTFFLKDFRQETEEGFVQRLRTAVRMVRENRRFLLVLLPLALLEAIAQVITMALNQPFYRQVGIPSRYFGWMLALVRGLLMLAAFLPSIVKMGERRIIVLFALTGTIACLALGSAQSAAVVVAAIVVFRIAYGIFQPIRMNLQNRHSEGAYRAAMLAVYALPFRLSSIAMNSLLGWIADRSLSAAAFTACGMLAMLVVLCTVCYRESMLTKDKSAA